MAEESPEVESPEEEDFRVAEESPEEEDFRVAEDSPAEEDHLTEDFRVVEDSPAEEDHLTEDPQEQDRLQERKYRRPQADS